MDEKDDRGADSGAESSAWRASTLVFTRQNIEVKIVSVLIAVYITNLKVRDISLSIDIP